MAGVKTTSYVDAIAREVRAENLADVKASLEAVEAELEHMRMDEEKDQRHLIGLIAGLEERIEELEKDRGRVAEGKGVDK